MNPLLLSSSTQRPGRLSTSRWSWVTAAVLFVGAGSSWSSNAFGQEGKVVVASPGEAPPGQPPGQPVPPGSTPPGQPPNGAKPADGAEKKDAPSEPIKRTSAPPEAPNKRELDVKPDETGKVQFQFRNQAWPDVLKWLAETSQMSLDWQELPETISTWPRVARTRSKRLATCSIAICSCVGSPFWSWKGYFKFRKPKTSTPRLFRKSPPRNLLPCHLTDLCGHRFLSTHL